MIKPFVPLAALFLLAFGTIAHGADGTCIDAHASYEAHTQGLHDVVIRRSIGKPRPPLLLTTTCIGLEKADAVSVSSPFNCVGQGDTVVATHIGGERQFCRVTHVAPYVPPPEPAKP